MSLPPQEPTSFPSRRSLREARLRAQAEAVEASTAKEARVEAPTEVTAEVISEAAAPSAPALPVAAVTPSTVAGDVETADLVGTADDVEIADDVETADDVSLAATASREPASSAAEAEADAQAQAARLAASLLDTVAIELPSAPAQSKAEQATQSLRHGLLLSPDLTFTPQAVHPLTQSVELAEGEATELAGSAPNKAKPRMSPKRLVGAAFSIVCVGALAVTTTLPAFSHSVGTPAGATPASLSAQELQSSNAEVTQDALEAIGTVEFGIDPSTYKQLAPEAGLVDPATLPETDIRMPFDQTFPLTDGFAYRTEPVEQFHDAQDIAAPGGTPVLAIGSGEVLLAGYATDGCGFSVKIQHNVQGETLTSRYCHMQVGSHDLAVGDKIDIGQQIGRVGNTGMSFGDHLHLALRRSGVPIDPLPYIDAQIEKAQKRAEKAAR